MNTFRDPITHNTEDVPETYAETNKPRSGAKLNWLRAAVLGANDGVVSISSLIVGVAGATNSAHFIVTAGIAGTVAGALSMAVGEFVSVSSQRDAERVLLERKRLELINDPEGELKELASIYQHKGLSPQTAQLVAEELTKRDAFAAHVDAELNIDPDDLTNPAHAAYASAIAFFCGALIPLLAALLSPPRLHILMIFISVIIALTITGTLSAHVGGASKIKATTRVIIGGVLAMAVTYGIGKLFGVSGI